LAFEHYVAVTLSVLGRYHKSLEQFGIVLEKKIKAFGEEDDRTINTCHSIAVDLFNLGDYEEALKLFEDALRKYKAVLGTTT